MATNKNAQVRYQILDRCFADKHARYTIEDLLEKVNEELYDCYGRSSMIKLRQLREDIKQMRMIIRDTKRGYRVGDDAIKAYPTGNGKECYYRYSAPAFSIYNNELSTTELRNLRSTIDMLKHYRGLPNSGWLENVINGLECRFGLRNEVEQLVSFDKNEELEGLNWLSTIIDATIEHRCLSITYKPYGKEEKRTLFHPYYVKQYNNRWFVFGLEVTDRGSYIANKALDRIVMVFLTDDTFIENTSIDFSSYFDDIIGVTMPSDDVKEEVVLLRFSAQRYPYVISKPLHHSQEEIDADNHIIKMKVRPNRELEQQIFSFGPDVEVLEPVWLRTQIHTKIKELIKKYSSMQNGCTEA